MSSDWKPWYQKVGGSLAGLFWLTAIVALFVLGATIVRALWMGVRFVWDGVLW